jgi:excisionase family DNA binding protein
VHLRRERRWPDGSGVRGAGTRARLRSATTRLPEIHTLACARMRASSLPPGNTPITGPGVRVSYARFMRGPDSGRYLTLVEVARRTGLEQSWLRRLCQRGDLPAVKAGRDWLVAPRDLAAFERRHRGRPPKG